MQTSNRAFKDNLFNIPLQAALSWALMDSALSS